MERRYPKKNSQNNAKRENLLDRFFSQIESFAYTYSFFVISISLVLALLSVWVTAERLTFKTGRGDLVSKDLPYVQRHEKFREEFENFEGMIVVIEGEDPVQKKNFVESLVQRIKSHPAVFSDVFYKIDTSYFKDKALLYLDQTELADLGKKIQENQDLLKQVNASPGLNQLMKSINSRISSGMVDALLTDFLGTSEEDNNEETDLGLLVALVKQMVLYLGERPHYVSPWGSMFSQQGRGPLIEEGYLVSGKNGLLFILVTPKEDKSVFTKYKESVQFARKLVAETKVEFPGIRVGITGEDVIASDEMVTTQSDIQKATLIALAGVSLLFILAFRGIIKPLMAVFCLLVALCWSMGFTTLTVGNLNILSVVFTTILIGLGIDFGIHILERYKEERIAGKDILSALQKTVKGTGRGNFAGAITTAMAFGAMTFTDFVGIAELGWIAAGGILLCMFAMTLLLPALLAVEEKWRRTDYNHSLKIPERKNWPDRLYSHYYTLIAVSLVFVALAAFSLRHVRFDYNLLNLQSRNTEAVKYELKILQDAKRSAWSANMVADTVEEARKKQRAAEALSTVGEVESIVSVMPGDQEEKIKYIRTLSPLLKTLQVVPEDEPVVLKPLLQTMKRIRFKLQGRENKDGATNTVQEAGRWVQRFLDEARRIEPGTAQQRLAVFSRVLFVDYREKIADLRKNADPTSVQVNQLPEELRKRFISKKGRYLITIFPGVDIWDIDQREKFLRQLRTVDPNVVGNAVHMFESSRLMLEGYIHGGIYALGAIVIFVLLTFKTLKTVFLIFLPVVVGSIWTIGIMDLLGVRFNLANLVILPLILGIGVVNGIHIIHRYREETDKKTTVLSKSTGKAVILSSLTTMIGFGSMMIADHQGIYSLGLVLTVGVGSCLVASVTFLPAILKLSTIKGWKV